jgi:hypothetical protein
VSRLPQKFSVYTMLSGGDVNGACGGAARMGRPQAELGRCKLNFAETSYPLTVETATGTQPLVLTPGLRATEY